MADYNEAFNIVDMDDEYYNRSRNYKNDNIIREKQESALKKYHESAEYKAKLEEHMNNIKRAVEVNNADKKYNNLDDLQEEKDLQNICENK